jgi:protein SCO1/2
MKTHQFKLILALLLLVVLQSCAKPVSWHATDITGKMPDLAFSLVGPDGSNIQADALLGKPALIFFGFTSCPDVCPTTLTRLGAILKTMHTSEDIQVVLVTVDPSRDTPEKMQAYTSSFGSWLLGLTGPEAALKTLRKSYGVYAAMESSDDKGTYNVMHNTAIFAFDRKGRARLLISDISDSDAIISDLKQLINL